MIIAKKSLNANTFSYKYSSMVTIAFVIIAIVMLVKIQEESRAATRFLGLDFS